MPDGVRHPVVVRWDGTLRRRVALVCVAVAIALGVGVALSAGGEPTETFCTAEGWLWEDGEVYGRSGAHDCQFVDADGDLLTHGPDGAPICYGELMRLVDCDEPGARPAA